ncbi:DinB family protein [Chitinophaga japonensis]|uniref:Putative damage-inducible protein DinB n=1 Tax=Chitinophaga japonensis TaxID=104662 RepID=A0A562TFY5_CHIJA|nr:DinB family protein [Chitinophaga japonensis]TWI92168.1 putative damage-inducible protein DinB [Chitinophaga japonensis]
MDKKYFLTLAAYNSWANNIAIAWLDQVNGRQWEQVVPSSFSSIKQTVIHIASAEKIWIDFWKNIPDPVYLSAEFKGTKNDLVEIWRAASAGLRHFIEEYPEENYTQQVTFRYPRGGEGRMEFWQTFSHIINHSTYHRGQLVTILRQVGFTKFSSIDLATFYRDPHQ